MLKSRFLQGVAGLLNAAAVAITGGSINGTTIGATSQTTGQFTTLLAQTNFRLTPTDISGTPGNGTVNTPRGRCAIAAAGSTITITSSIAATTSTILAQCSSNDATAIVKNCVPANGSFVINLNAAATGTAVIDFIVINV